jgi:hypothetical protein
MEKETLITIAAIGVTGMLAILLFMPIPILAKQSVQGMDIIVQYTDGTRRTISSPTSLSVLKQYAVVSWDEGSAGKEVQQYWIRPWVIVTYEGEAASWSVTGDLTIELFDELNGWSLGVVYSKPLAAYNPDAPPASGVKEYVADIGITGTQLEDWVGGADGLYSAYITVNPTVTMTDPTGTSTTMSADRPGYGYFTFEVRGASSEVTATLNIISVKAGVETNVITPQGEVIKVGA